MSREHLTQKLAEERTARIETFVQLVGEAIVMGRHGGIKSIEVMELRAAGEAIIADLPTAESEFVRRIVAALPPHADCLAHLDDRFVVEVPDWPEIKAALLDGTEAKGTPATKSRKRRRRTGSKINPLTPEQVEAMQLVGEHKGNFTAAAKATGKTRQAMEKLYKKALLKMGKRNTDKVKTESLKTDRRGQDDISENDDRRK